MRQRRRRQIAGLAGLLAVAAILCLLRLLIDRPPDGGLGLRWPEPSFASFRIAAMVAGIIVGTTLATSGVLLQALLRNPLASPFILGIASGAGLGVIVAMYLGHRLHIEVLVHGTNTLPALMGAIATLAVVYALGQRRGWLDPMSLVLVGVIVSAVCGALIMFFQHLVQFGLRDDLLTWMMGSLPEQPSSRALWLAGGLAGLGLIVSVWCGRAMDAATLGDDEARSVGLALGPLRLGMFLIAGVLTAVAVALAGPISFVGLIAPHAARLVLGPRHAVLVVGAALAGIGLVVGADVARQGLDFGAGRMPIGIFTALIGGPAFLWLLRSGKGAS